MHAMQAAQVEPSSLSHKGLAGWLGWLAGWPWVQGRRPYAKPGSLDAECFGVQPPAVGPWQRALQAAGGVRPLVSSLVFGQYGEFGSGLQTLLDELALAGAAEAAERYLLESSAAAAAVQKRLLRQRLVCCVAQAQADVLLSRLHLCLPGWRAAEGRRRRAEQQFEWQEAARARGLEWDARGSDSSDFDEPQGAHRHH